MPPDTNNFGSVTGCESHAVLVLPAALRQLAESGDTELIDELIAIFQTDTAGRLENLQRAVAAGDYEVAGAEAHTIKGSASQVGANRLAEFCRQMEWESKKRPPVGLAGLLSLALESFDEVCRAIAGRTGTEFPAVSTRD